MTQILSKLQGECPDFSDIMNFLKDQTLPEDQKLYDIIVSESKHFSLVDGVLYHWYQRRCKKVPKEISFIKQVALPTPLRLDALISYHDSLAGGGHLGIDKVKLSLIQKYYWPKMHKDITEYVRSCDRCQRAKATNHTAKPPMTNDCAHEKRALWLFL